MDTIKWKDPRVKCCDCDQYRPVLVHMPRRLGQRKETECSVLRCRLDGRGRAPDVLRHCVDFQRANAHTTAKGRLALMEAKAVLDPGLATELERYRT